jgi:23S rRNA-/tRNA-specific pseudouridylate synthase
MLLENLAVFGLGHDEGQRLLSFGAIYHERKRVHADRPVLPGDYVRVHLQPKRFPVDAVEWRAVVVEHNDEFLVVNKPPGVPVHATVDNQLENVVHQLSVEFHTRLYVTQRLDTEVSGLLVLARTREFQRYFNALLFERKVRKRYRALVTQAPETGRHTHYMKRAERSPKVVRKEPQPDWLECILAVQSVTPIASLFEVEIDLETGRTHQIRAQLAAMGSPIIGDRLYGSQTEYEINGMPRPGIALVSVATSWSGEDGRTSSFVLNESRARDSSAVPHTAGLP